MGTSINCSANSRLDRGMPGVGTVPDDAITQKFVKQCARRTEGDAVDTVGGRALIDDEKPGVGGAECMQVERPVAIDMHDESRTGHDRTSQRGIRETVT